MTNTNHLKQVVSLTEWIKKERRKLWRGCGSYNNYWGHKCKSTFINTSGKKVTAYCDKCDAKLELLRKIKKEARGR